MHSVPVAAGFSFLDTPPLVPLLQEGGATVAGAVVHEKGRAYVIGDTAPLSNDGLRRGDSAMFLLSLLERARGGRIGVDEFHHGEGGGTGGGAGTVFNGPIGVAAAVVVVVVLAALALNGRRLGRPDAPDATVTVPSAAGYVQAMGDLLSRSRRRGHVAARYADELKRRAGAVTGIDPHFDDDAFIAALRASQPDPATAVARLLARARQLQAGRPDEAALLQLARDVDSLQRELSRGLALPAQLRG